MAKENTASPEPSAAEPAAAPTGFLSRLLPRTRGKAIVYGGLAVAIIGVSAVAALILWQKSEPSATQQLSRAFAELDKGNRSAARQLAAKLLADTASDYTQHGGAYFVLGAVTLQEAEVQIKPDKRRMLNLVAARYLEEARSRGIPEPRRRAGLLSGS